ncbi:MAG TPA: hypothetical protein PLC04_03470 [Candidatus Kapabacteria bacterium]|jgi:hypothetical protein|nr:hypothetical protein [Candidatus Kapabacteria bacterium]HOV92123.1 hypothetical protein [Candidatus Kapabacteria bacterium]
MFKKILIAVLAVMLAACSSEKLIDESSSNQKLIVASFDGANSHILSTDLKSTLTESNDLFSQANSNYIANSPITRLQAYLNYIFAFVPDENKIIVFNKNTFKYVAQINFSSQGLRPLKLAFANATDAYLICENYNKLILVDIYYFKAAREIDLPASATDILSLGNQVFIALPFANQIAIVDSRTHTIASSIAVDNRPYIFALTSEVTNLIVLSAGAGKLNLDHMGTLSAPSVTNINLSSNSVTGSNPLTIPYYDITNKYPLQFAITNNDWAFIALDSMLIKMDARDITFAINLYNAQIFSFTQNYIANDLFALEKTDNGTMIEKLDPISGSLINNLQTQLNITSFVSL